jgi:hypothetical protein
MRTEKVAFVTMLQELIATQTSIQLQATRKHVAFMSGKTVEGPVGEIQSFIEAFQSDAELNSTLHISKEVQRSCESAITKIHYHTSDKEEDKEDESTSASSNADPSEMADFIDQEYSASESSHADSLKHVRLHGRRRVMTIRRVLCRIGLDKDAE